MMEAFEEKFRYLQRLVRATLECGFPSHAAALQPMKATPENAEVLFAAVMHLLEGQAKKGWLYPHAVSGELERAAAELKEAIESPPEEAA